MAWRVFGPLLSRAQFALWSFRNPGASFKEFYADSVTDALTGKEQHPSLGPHVKSGGSSGALNTFNKLVSQGIRPSDTLVDFGCGTLRIGSLFIEHLEADRYIGMDIDQRILAAGLSQLPAKLVESKRPTLEVISAESLARVAARQPRWVCSKGVLQHVPPQELNEFFGNLSRLIHAGAIGLLYSAASSQSKRIGVKAWVHDIDDLQAAAQRQGMKFDKLRYRAGGLMRLERHRS
jgi:Histidine-specific methyltransferase, SAM-dependent